MLVEDCPHCGSIVIARVLPPEAAAVCLPSTTCTPTLINVVSGLYMSMDDLAHQAWTCLDCGAAGAAS
jgi:hypothetical protein